MPRDARAARGQLVAADRADRRVIDRRVGPVAGLQQVGAALVVALLAHHRPDQRDRAHLLGEPAEAVGELHALHGRVDGLRAAGDRLAGLGVERLELARPALQPEQDDRLRRLAAIARPARRAVADGRQPAHAGQAERLQESAATGKEQARRMRMRQWFHENSVALTSVQKMSDIRSSRSLPFVPASFASKWASSSGVGLRVSTVR